MKRKGTQDMGDTYQHLMGAPQDPRNHPSDNVSHPHGNRGRMDATIPINSPMSTNTGEYQDGI
jgi:hypothetical protein